MVKKFPGLKVAGTYCPPFRELSDFEKDEIEVTPQISRITKESLPDGWTFKTVTRKTGDTKGKVDYYFYDEAKNKYSSINSPEKC